MKYLVTGGAGFIGSNLTRYLLAQGARVVVLDDLSTGKIDNLAEILPQIEFRQGDIRSRSDVESAIAGCDGAFHLAAMASVQKSVENPRLAHEINVGGTLTILEAMVRLGVKRFVLSASAAAYGNQPDSPKTENLPPEPLSPYAADKLACEAYAQAYVRSFGLESVCLRYFNVFGPRQDPNGSYAAVIPAFVCRLLQGKAPVVYGDGEQTRDFCFIDNVCRANWLASQIPAEKCLGKPINVACGEAVSLNQILLLLKELLKSGVKAVYQPARIGDVKHSLADISRAKDVLGYVPQVRFAEGLAQAIDWYCQQYRQGNRLAE